ncbi:ER membrane protein complex subunit 8-like [Mya arenaria]|uniref:ER membrane protein complex subunit 8-like n=1 Tax=Mya arenaria TaxID=6604 RepID=UPI0022E375B1|nr:ER membrane protein complex subunit 8-like [Mya arenaria]
MADISVSIQAYAKLLLHAAKYPHCAVNGILLAEDSKNVKEKKQIKFVDCIPLFHISLTLAPMLEAALLQIDSYCKSKGYVIGGYYQANEHLQDNDLNPIARHIGKKIHDYYPDACIFMIDNNRVNPESTRDVYKVFSMKDSADWKEVKNDTIDEDTRQTSAVLLEQEQFRYLTDFDNHLDNVANDWRNTQLNELISKCS